MQMTYAESDKVYRHLWDLKRSFDPKANRRERAVAMIGACILNGFNTRLQILKGLRSRGLSVDHFLGLLDDHTGTVPGIHLWRLDDDGQYYLLDVV